MSNVTRGCEAATADDGSSEGPPAGYKLVEEKRLEALVMDGIAVKEVA